MTRASLTPCYTRPSPLLQTQLRFYHVLRLCTCAFIMSTGSTAPLPASVSPRRTPSWFVRCCCWRCVCMCVSVHPGYDSPLSTHAPSPCCSNTRSCSASPWEPSRHQAGSEAPQPLCLSLSLSLSLPLPSQHTPVYGHAVQEEQQKQEAIALKVPHTHKHTSHHPPIRTRYRRL